MDPTSSADTRPKFCTCDSPPAGSVRIGDEEATRCPSCMQVQKAEPVFEWRAVVEVDGIHSAIESDWEPWEGPEADPEKIQELVSGKGDTSMGFEAAASAAGFSYGIQVRRIGES